jgi:hypothetical protein
VGFVGIFDPAIRAQRRFFFTIGVEAVGAGHI